MYTFILSIASSTGTWTPRGWRQARAMRRNTPRRNATNMDTPRRPAQAKAPRTAPTTWRINGVAIKSKCLFRKFCHLSNRQGRLQMFHGRCGRRNRAQILALRMGGSRGLHNRMRTLTLIEKYIVYLFCTLSFFTTWKYMNYWNDYFPPSLNLQS